MTYPLYLIAGHLLLPLIFLRLLIKSRRNPPYRRRWSERLGFYQQRPTVPPIWIHTVSVGEFNAAKPLIAALKEAYPNSPLLVTTTTPTGSAAVTRYSSELYHVYLPYDLPLLVRRFLRHWQPRAGIIFETEIWPALFRNTAAANIPLIMANARLSAKSAQGYQRIKPLIADALRLPNAIAAATEEDASRLKGLGADPQRLSVMGNIKFDYQLADSIRKSAAPLRDDVLGKARPVWVAASTHAGEEAQVLQAHAAIRKLLPDTLLVLVPRHPERFNEVARLCTGRFATIRRSEGGHCTINTAVYLADSMGELPLFYAAADAVFVGGSLVPTGGHNLIEPAAAGKAPLFGLHMENFIEIAERLLAAEGAIQIKNGQELAEKIIQLLSNPADTARLGANAMALVEQHRGAVQALTSLLAKHLEQP